MAMSYDALQEECFIRSIIHPMTACKLKYLTGNKYARKVDNEQIKWVTGELGYLKAKVTLRLKITIVNNNLAIW